MNHPIKTKGGRLATEAEWLAAALLKVSASYRLDAFFNVFSTLDVRNDPTKLQRMDRYVHGPRLAVSAQF
jgi:hypothetical protein